MRTAGFLLAAFLLLASGVVAGVWNDRWSVSEQRTTFAARLQAVPGEIAGWKGTSLTLDARQMQVADADANLYRTFERTTNRQRREVTLIVLSGRTPAVAAHTPDVCFVGSGYHMDGAPEIRTIGEHSLWSARFWKPPEPASFRVYWGWSNGSRWTAPFDARLSFARSPALYKLYAVGRAESDDAAQFLTDALPELHRGLTSP